MKGVKEPADKGMGGVGKGGIPGRGNSQGKDPEIEVCLTLLMNCKAAVWIKQSEVRVMGDEKLFGGSKWGEGAQRDTDQTQTLL